MPFGITWILWTLTRQGRIRLGILKDAQRALQVVDVFPSRLGELVSRVHRGVNYTMIFFKNDHARGYQVWIADEKRPVGTLVIGRPIEYGELPELRWVRSRTTAAQRG